MSFWEKYNQARKLNNSYVCVGLDSNIEKIPNSLKKEENPILAFNKMIIDATKDKVLCYKPNYAFYIQAGKMGLEALEKTIEYIPDYIPVILDVKVGDIGNTMASYAKGYFDYLKVDSITVNPLMGSDVFAPLLEYKDKMLFSLALTSNKSASDYLLRDELYKKIASDLNDIGEKQIGAVVGATQVSEIRLLRNLMPKTIFLIPGIGAQGGDLQNVVQSAKATAEDPRFVINSSRGIIFASNNNDFVEMASKACEKLRLAINSQLDF